MEPPAATPPLYMSAEGTDGGGAPPTSPPPPCSLASARAVLQDSVLRGREGEALRGLLTALAGLQDEQTPGGRDTSLLPEEAVAEVAAEAMWQQRGSSSSSPFAGILRLRTDPFVLHSMVVAAMCSTNRPAADQALLRLAGSGEGREGGRAPDSPGDADDGDRGPSYDTQQQHHHRHNPALLFLSNLHRGAALSMYFLDITPGGAGGSGVGSTPLLPNPPPPRLRLSEAYREFRFDSDGEFTSDLGGATPAPAPAETAETSSGITEIAFRISPRASAIRRFFPPFEFDGQRGVVAPLGTSALRRFLFSHRGDAWRHIVWRPGCPGFTPMLTASREHLLLEIDTAATAEALLLLNKNLPGAAPVCPTFLRSPVSVGALVEAGIGRTDPDTTTALLASAAHLHAAAAAKRGGSSSLEEASSLLHCLDAQGGSEQGGGTLAALAGLTASAAASASAAVIRRFACGLRWDGWCHDVFSQHALLLGGGTAGGVADGAAPQEVIPPAPCLLPLEAFIRRACRGGRPAAQGRALKDIASLCSFASAAVFIGQRWSGGGGGATLLRRDLLCPAAALLPQVLAAGGLRPAWDAAALRHLSRGGCGAPDSAEELLLLHLLAGDPEACARQLDGGAAAAAALLQAVPPGTRGRVASQVLAGCCPAAAGGGGGDPGQRFVKGAWRFAADAALLGFRAYYLARRALRSGGGGGGGGDADGGGRLESLLSCEGFCLVPRCGGGEGSAVGAAEGEGQQQQQQPPLGLVGVTAAVVGGGGGGDADGGFVAHRDADPMAGFLSDAEESSGGGDDSEGGRLSASSSSSSLVFGAAEGAAEKKRERKKAKKAKKRKKKEKKEKKRAKRRREKDEKARRRKRQRVGGGDAARQPAEGLVAPGSGAQVVGWDVTAAAGVGAGGTAHPLGPVFVSTFDIASFVMQHTASGWFASVLHAFRKWATEQQLPASADPSPGPCLQPA